MLLGRGKSKFKKLRDMEWKDFLRDYFSFTRKERIGIIVLVVIIGVVWLLPSFLPSTPAGFSVEDSLWISSAGKILDSMHAKPSSEKGRDETRGNRSFGGVGYVAPPRELFPFDPNSLPAEGWKRLGIRERTIQTIRNYVSRGGRFRVPEDLGKIYGLSSEDLKALLPYVRIVSGPVKEVYPRREQSFSNLPSPRSRQYEFIDINLADTSAFISLPGIGSKLAARIVSFREKLGGFYSEQQLREVYGLKDSVFEKIRPWLRLADPELKKINVNLASVEELKSHPYLRFALANAIVSYRSVHGQFESVEDLRKLKPITDEIFEKIRFYLITK